jgi:hypothetical protein
VSAAPEQGTPAVAPADADEPPDLPMPCPDVHHLGRWEGILGWAAGWIIGMALAAAAIVALVVR